MAAFSTFLRFLNGKCMEDANQSRPIQSVHETGLRRVLKDYFAYYERCRTHVSLEKDAPVSRPVDPPSLGFVIESPKIGGLHHLYTRKAA